MLAVQQTWRGSGWRDVKANEKTSVLAPGCSPARTERLSAVQLTSALTRFSSPVSISLVRLKDSFVSWKTLPQPLRKIKQNGAGHTSVTHAFCPPGGTGSAKRPVLLLQYFLVTCRVMHFPPSYKQFNNFQSCFSMLWNRVVLVSIPAKLFG